MLKSVKNIILLIFCSLHLTFEFKFFLKLKLSSKSDPIVCIEGNCISQKIKSDKLITDERYINNYGNQFEIYFTSGSSSTIAGYFVFDGIQFTTGSLKWEGGGAGDWKVENNEEEIDKIKCKILSYKASSSHEGQINISFFLPSKDKIDEFPNYYVFVPRYECKLKIKYYEIYKNEETLNLEIEINPSSNGVYLVFIKPNDFKGELYKDNYPLDSFFLMFSNKIQFTYKIKESKGYHDYIYFYVLRRVGVGNNGFVMDSEVQKVPLIVCNENCRCSEKDYYCKECVENSGKIANSNDNKCYTKDELIHFYQDDNLYYPCHTSCNSCTYKLEAIENEEFHNCKTCSSSYSYRQKFLNTQSINCYMSCPLGTFVSSRKKECFNCLISKSQNENNFCAIEIIPISENIFRTELTQKELEGYISEILKDPNNMIINGENFKYEIYKTYKDNKDLSNITSLHRKIIKESFNLRKIQDLSDISFLDLGDCEKKIREKHKIDENDPLIISKIDIYEGSVIPKVAYTIFDKEGKKLEFPEDCKIKISFPILDKEKINLNKAKEIYDESGADIYDANDKIFNDICFPYSDSNKGDTILKDRRKDLHINVSICDKGCNLIRFNYTVNKSECECDPKSKDVEKQKFEILGDSLWKSTNLVIFKCYNLAFTKKDIYNIGFYLFGIFFLIQIFSSIILPYEINLSYKRMFRNIYYSEKRISQTDKKTFQTDNQKSDAGFIKRFSIPKEDNKDNIFLYFNFVFSKIELLRIFFCHEEHELYSLKISCYLFSVSSDFAINAFLFSDDIISQKYHNELNRYTNFILSIASNVIGYIISSIVTKLVSYEIIFEMLKDKGRNEKYFIRKFIKVNQIIKIKATIFIVFECLFMICYIYFICIFNTLYHSSQVSWIKNSLTGMSISLIISLFQSLIFVLTKKIAFCFKNKDIYRIYLYISS